MKTTSNTTTSASPATTGHLTKQLAALSEKARALSTSAGKDLSDALDEAMREFILAEMGGFNK